MSTPRQDHPCDACGGSETLFRVKADPDFHEPDALIEAPTVRHAVNEWERQHPGMLWFSAAPARAACPVCLGSGRISDRMPVSDAVADAETLYGSVVAAAPGCLFHVLLEEAQDADIFMEDQDWEIKAIAKKRAWAAFRAVPGLREQD